MSRNDAAANAWRQNLDSEVKKIEDIDPEFEIAHEREELRRVVHGEEFDVVTKELMQRLEQVEARYKTLEKEIDALHAWMKVMARDW